MRNSLPAAHRGGLFAVFVAQQSLARVQAQCEETEMRFQSGESGNPAGRPRGVRNPAIIALQRIFEGDAEQIAEKVVELAKTGEISAIRVCLDRLLPVRRSAATGYELPPLTKAADSVTAAAAIAAGV